MKKNKLELSTVSDEDYPWYYLWSREDAFGKWDAWKKNRWGGSINATTKVKEKKKEKKKKILLCEKHTACHCFITYLFMVFLTYKIICTRFFFSFDFKINPFMLFMHLTRKCHPSLTSFWLFFSTSNRLRSCLEKMRWKAICGSVHTSCP